MAAKAFDWNDRDDLARDNLKSSGGTPDTAVRLTSIHKKFYITRRKEDRQLDVFRILEAFFKEREGDVRTVTTGGATTSKTTGLTKHELLVSTNVEAEAGDRGVVARLLAEMFDGEVVDDELAVVAIFVAGDAGAEDGEGKEQGRSEGLHGRCWKGRLAGMSARELRELVDDERRMLELEKGQLYMYFA